MEDANVKNAADEAQVEEGGAKAQRLRAQELSDVRQILSTKGGRRFMWRLLSASGVYRLSFAGEQSHTTAFQDGERNVGLRFLADVMDADPKNFLVMSDENKPKGAKSLV